MVAAFSFLSLTIAAAERKIDFLSVSANPLYLFTVLVLVCLSVCAGAGAAAADLGWPLSFQFYIIVSLKYLIYVHYCM